MQILTRTPDSERPAFLFFLFDRVRSCVLCLQTNQNPALYLSPQPTTKY